MKKAFMLIITLFLTVQVAYAGFDIVKCEFRPHVDKTEIRLFFDSAFVSEVEQRFKEGLDFHLVLEVYSKGRKVYVKDYYFSYDVLSGTFVVRESIERRFKSITNFRRLLLNPVFFVPYSLDEVKVRAISEMDYVPAFFKLFIGNYKTQLKECRNVTK